MKILYHHRTASRDGQAVHIEEMVAALRSLGHDVLVVAPDGGRDDAMGARVGWVHRLKRWLPGELYELLELAYSLPAYRRLKQAAVKFQPDFIYERYNLFLLSGGMLRARLGVPLLLEVNAPLVVERSLHGGLALGWLARWAESRAWRQADFVLPVTRVLARHVLAAGVPESQIAVIPNGINEAHFVDAPSPDRARREIGLEGFLVLGFTGFVRPWHGVDRVIRWMSGSKAPSNTFLLMVGDGPARADLEGLARQCGVGHRVRFTGVIDRADVPRHVAAFDIALQPAVTAYASPLKLMEYLFLAKAIVAPREPNLLEVLRDDGNALMFESGDDAELEQVLTRLCQDGELRLRLGQQARATVDRLGLTWTGNARKVIDLAQQAKARMAPSAKSGG